MNKSNTTMQFSRRTHVSRKLASGLIPLQYHMDRYSTLEVNHNAADTTPTPPDYSRFPEAVPVEQQPHDNPFDQTPKEYVPSYNLSPEVVPNQEDHGISTIESLTAGNALIGKSIEKANTRSQRICGLKRLTFFIILGIAILVVIGAIVGGVVGGVVSNKSSSTERENETPNQVSVMDISSLAASNWTDGKGYNHRTVFFQDPWNAVIARRWDSQNNTWSTTNITAVSSNAATPLVAARGTSLASATLDWPNAYTVKLYFLDPWDVIRATYSDSPVHLPDLWKNDTLGSSNINVMRGSKLAATWARAEDPTQVGVWTIAWQGPNRGFIKVGNFSDYNASVNGVNANKVAGNTSLALVPMYGGLKQGLGLISQSYTSGTSGSMQVSGWNETWKNPTEVISNIPLPARDQHVAVSKWSDWNTTLCYTLLDDGTMKGSWWEDETHQNTLSQINTSGGPTGNFSAIAMTLDAMFYGITNDEVHEYAVDAEDPAKLNWIGKIYP